MADIRKVTDGLAVAPQLLPQDMATAATLGYRLVINNRPDGEDASQPSSAQRNPPPASSTAQPHGQNSSHQPIGRSNRASAA